MTSSNSFRVGQEVVWKWGNGEGRGEIKERFERDVERTLKGSHIKRIGTKENPAYLIEQDDGDEVLKSGSELDGT